MTDRDPQAGWGSPALVRLPISWAAGLQRVETRRGSAAALR
jgi:hypothetical protein